MLWTEIVWSNELSKQSAQKQFSLFFFLLILNFYWRQGGGCQLKQCQVKAKDRASY